MPLYFPEASNLFRTYLKNNLSAHGGVEKRFKMLTYYVYAPLFHRFALPAAGFRKAQLAPWTLILFLR